MRNSKIEKFNDEGKDILSEYNLINIWFKWVNLILNYRDIKKKKKILIEFEN
jgi:hypothetical protein